MTDDKEKENIKLRLLLFKECNRNCLGCCNNDWDLDNLSICNSYLEYSEILLTGGEPMLHPDIIVEAITEIRKQTKSPIILYTAKTDNQKELLYILSIIDGVTITLHDQSDVLPFLSFAKQVSHKNKSLRVNIFKGVCITNIPDGWVVKDNIVWIKNCPLPVGEVLQRYQIISETATDALIPDILVKQGQIIHDFVSTLIENSENPDPKFSEVVSGKFWDLI